MNNAITVYSRGGGGGCITQEQDKRYIMQEQYIQGRIMQEQYTQRGHFEKAIYSEVHYAIAVHSEVHYSTVRCRRNGWGGGGLTGKHT